MCAGTTGVLRGQPVNFLLQDCSHLLRGFSALLYFQFFAVTCFVAQLRAAGYTWCEWQSHCSSLGLQTERLPLRFGTLCCNEGREGRENIYKARTITGMGCLCCRSWKIKSSRVLSPGMDGKESKPELGMWAAKDFQWTWSGPCS